MLPDPWEPIGTGKAGLTARRVDPSHPANFFWAKDSEGRCSLMLKLGKDASAQEPRPKLNGIELIESEEPNGSSSFVLVLRRSEDRELFQRLCEDIVESCRHLNGDSAYLSAAIRRAWKWHSLLRGAALAKLSREQQQGLVGELLMVEILADLLPPKALLAGWRGPLDEPKDFVLGHTAIEVKARHVTKDAVKISSEHQLQLQGGQALWLVVMALAPESPGATGAFTLDALVERVGRKLTAIDPSADAAFQSLLLSAGYSADDDYSEDAWAEIDNQAYEIDAAFPRIQAVDLPAGLSNVTYWLALNDCAAHARPIAAVLESLDG